MTTYKKKITTKRRRIKVERLSIVIAFVIALPILFVASLILIWNHYKPIELQESAVATYIEPEQVVQSEVLVPEYIVYDTGVKLSFYCSCGECNGYDSDGNPRSVNAYDEPLTYGMCASNYYPQGFTFYLNINGVYQEFVVCDKMHEKYNDVKIIDIYVPVSHEECEELGIYKNVAIYTKN